MGAGLSILSAVVLLALLACLLRRWASVLLLALVELSWVALCVTYGLLTVQYRDVTYLFWAACLLMFSAVELVLGALLFLLHAEHAAPTRALWSL